MNTMHIPEYEERNGIPPGVAANLRRQLRGLGKAYKWFQGLIGALFPLLEAILVGLAISETGKPDGRSWVFWFALFIIGLVHVALLITVLVYDHPLPQFLIQFDEEKSKRLSIQRREEITRGMRNLNLAALGTAFISLNKLTEEMGRRPKDTWQSFEAVLSPWILGRSEIFQFPRDALYNFAIYLYDPNTNRLKRFYRKRHSRLRTYGREWQPPDGHVGYCYSHVPPETVFTYCTITGGIRKTMRTNQPRPTDDEQYKSFAATPLVVNGRRKGVFLVTSNQDDQLKADLHKPVMDVVGWIMSRTLEYC